MTASCHPPHLVADPDAIWAAIVATDQQARLLRRLLRLAILISPPQPGDRKEVAGAS